MHKDWLNSFELGMFQVRLAKVNIDYAADVAMDYEVNVVPTVIAMKSGQVVARFEGVKADDELDDFIDSVIES